MNLTDTIITWIPMILIIGVWMFAMRLHRGVQNKIIRMNEDCLELNRRMLAELEEIKTLLKQRGDRV